MREMAIGADRQLEANEQAKKHLMRDWTLKQEAISLDHRSAAMTLAGSGANMRTPDGVQLELRDGMPLQRMSEYAEWVESTAVNLNNAAKNRVHSRKLAQARCSIVPFS
jgi:hypothetical protein